MKFSTIIATVAAAFILTACGEAVRAEACINGVTYLQFASGVTVKYNTDGSIATCRQP